MSALADLEARITSAPRDELPWLVGELARLNAIASFRIASEATKRPEVENPRLLTATEAAALLGMSVKWIYSHKSELGAVRLSGRAVRFPENRVHRYVTTRR
jgi:excisionase family DNA binding protein